MKKKVLNLMLVILFLLPFCQAANFDPPYPRIGQLTFYCRGSFSEIWKNHDLVITRHYCTSDAKKLKQANPEVIVLATNAGIHSAALKEALRYSGIKTDLPEEWYLYYEDGTKVPIWGANLMNVAEECPKANYIYGQQKFNEFLPQFLKENTDWSFFDGSYFDAWVASLSWMTSADNLNKMDINFDGIADGMKNIVSKWSSGNPALINNFRALSDKPIIANEGFANYLNGIGFEFWSQVHNPVSGHISNLGRLLSKTGIKPVIYYCNSEAGGYTAVKQGGGYEKLYGPALRADFTSSQLGGCFFGHDEGTSAHRWTFLHDEYEGYLGYPTSKAKTIANNVWVRYFDEGAVVSNIGGSPVTIQASQLTGGPYYRFLGSQDPEFNNGQIVDSNNPLHFAEMDGVMLFKKPTTLITPIIIDNVKYAMTSIDQKPVHYIGSWTQSTVCDSNGQKCRAVALGKDYYGLGYGWDQISSRYAFSVAGNGENKARYVVDIKIPGEYELFEWHGTLGDPPGGQVGSNVPYNIVHAGGTKSGTIDQTKNVGKWNSLGKYNFNKGESFVEISNAANGFVISDAMRFVFTGSSNYQPPESKPCSGFGGTPCQSNEECDGGSFRYSSDHGSLCCVGGSCKALEDGQEGGDGDGEGTDNSCVSGKGGIPCQSDDACVGGGFVSSSDHGDLCCVGGICKQPDSSDFNDSCHFLEHIEVPATGDVIVSTNILRTNVEYLVKTSGTYKYWYPNHPEAIADAEWAETTALQKQGWNKGEGAGLYSKEHNLDLMINNEAVDWGGYNENHTYLYELTGSNLRISFSIFDMNSRDNQGSISVTIFNCSSNRDNEGAIGGNTDPSDLNKDNLVDISDLILLIRAFGTSQHDLNGDGVVDVQDLLLIIKKL